MGRRVFSGRIMLEGALYDANEQLKHNLNSKEIYDKLQRKLIHIKRTEEGENTTVRWD